jgi:hypothetical protein
VGTVRLTTTVAGALASTVLLTALAGCMTRPGDVAAARAQWATLPAEVHDALGVGEPDGEAWGSIGEHWSISAPVRLDTPEAPPLLAATLTARCHAVVDALAGQDVQAYGVLPLVPGVVRATDETCARGLALGSWSTTPGSPDSVGRWAEEGELVLGRERDGRAEMLALTVRLDDVTLSTTSTIPPWTQELAPFDAAAWDAELARVAAVLPVEITAGTAPPERVVLAVPAGTGITATASCTPGERPTRVVVRSASTTDVGSSVTTAPVNPDEPPGGDPRVDCGAGTVTGPLRPSLTYTDTAGRDADVALVWLSDRPVWGSTPSTTLSAG